MLQLLLRPTLRMPKRKFPRIVDWVVLEPFYRYLDENTSSTTRYTTWFGTYTSTRHTEVLSHFSNMLDHPYADYTYDCSCTETDVYAYVYSDS